MSEAQNATASFIDADKLMGSAMSAASFIGGLGFTVLDATIKWSPVIVFLAMLGFLAKFAFEQSKNLWKQANANEWMLILKDGAMKKCGVGLQDWVMPWEQSITFPSQINQINFNAQQVTSEMQGVEVKGMIIWTVNKMEDGPFTCYKSFGSDLASKNPQSVNTKLGNMAVSIVRDRIANMTLDDVLKNRSKLRGGVKEEIQKVLSGWGIWLETIEVQDVRIMSSSLFKNLQTEYREKSRQEAEKISGNINQKIEKERLTRTLNQDKLEYKNNTNIAKQTLHNNLTVLKRKTDQARQANELTMKRNEIEFANQLSKHNQHVEKSKKEAGVYFDQHTLNTEMQIKNELNRQELIKAGNKADLVAVDAELISADTSKQAELNNLKKDLELKTKLYTPNVLNKMVIDSTKDIYCNLQMNNLNITSVGSDLGVGTQEIAGQLVSQMMSTYKTIESQLEPVAPKKK